MSLASNVLHLRPAGLAELHSELATLRPMEWYDWVEKVAQKVGLDLSANDAKSEQPHLPPTSLVYQLNHRNLRDFVAAPNSQNGLGCSWKEWEQKVTAYSVVKRYDIKHDIYTFELLNRYNEIVVGRLGREAATTAEWYIEFANHFVTQSRTESAMQSRTVLELTDELRKYRRTHDDTVFELRRIRDEQQPLRDLINQLTEQLAAYELEIAARSREVTFSGAEVAQREEKLRQESKEYYTELLRNGDDRALHLRDERDDILIKLNSANESLTSLSDQNSALQKLSDEQKSENQRLLDALNKQASAPDFIGPIQVHDKKPSEYDRYIKGCHKVIVNKHIEMLKFKLMMIRFAKERNKYKSMAKKYKRLYLAVPLFIRSFF